VDPTDPNPIRVTMMLADHAQAADGKLNIIGGGWTMTGPGPVPFAIAMMIEVPWNLANREHTFRLELIDRDGKPVMVEAPDGEQPIAIEGGFEVGRPAGLPAGTPLSVPLGINASPPPPIPSNGRYEWRLFINGETREDWRLGFMTRPDAQSKAA
jgi:hypothetical protein